ncbi:MAG: hypothetical protein H6603_00370 [Flavobacteriales bacterium]|nr:hypothetical protein [Flavobacteriales bacterium]MCB9203402.1 hypothetical protein [Flavobacteriales bacterium]
MKKLKSTIYTLALLGVICSLSGCLKNQADLEELFMDGGGDWEIVNHCSANEPVGQRSSLTFSSSGSGLIIIYRDCEMGGTPCTNSMRFFWEIDEDDERVNITWRNENSVLICSDLQDASYQRAPESFTFNAETQEITLWNHTWVKD